MAIHTADRGRIDSYKIEIGEGFGRRVRDARLASGLSVVRLARAAGVGRQTLINAEAGHAGGGLALAAAASLADALGVRRGWLAFGEGSQT